MGRILGELLFIGLIILLVFLAYSSAGSHEHQVRVRAIELSDVDNMDGLSFEHYVAWLLSNNGFKKVYVTQGSGDFGADIIATKRSKKYAIQVKRMSSIVSRHAISDAVAAREHYGCTDAIVVTNNYFSRQAEEFSLSTGCTLVDRDALADWIIKAGGAKRNLGFLMKKTTNWSETALPEPKRSHNYFYELCRVLLVLFILIFIWVLP